MPQLPIRLLLSFGLMSTWGNFSKAQTATPMSALQQTPSSDTKLNYPDTTSGLEHLAKDILKAQKANDATTADALLRSLILPNPQTWYTGTFGPIIGENDGGHYEKASAELPSALATNFLNIATQKLDMIEAKRFENSCDDNAGDTTFSLLRARIDPVPLYELRFFKGDKFARIFAFAFVDGSFRFIIAPKLEGPVFEPPANKPAPPSGSPSSDESNPALSRLQIGGNVQSAKLLNRIQPIYPEIARREHLQGTVLLHALIAKDGSVRKLYVLKGSCSLAESAVDAVSKWRYTPTLLMGNPVEVDTQIQVIFMLR